jgi:23S rRNA pseudouridine1911/1915/1917 synthase
MSQKYIVKKRSKLLNFLFEALEGWSKKTVKQRLKNESIWVNSQIQTKHDYFVELGDIIHISNPQQTFLHKSENTRQNLEILYQDKDLIAINKPAGLLSVATSKEKKNHALALLRQQLTRANKKVQLWPVHRLDRETSGILLFATSKEMREAVMKTWEQTHKSYLAIVEGTPKIAKDTIREPLRLDNAEYRMHVGKHKDAKSAITHYEVLKISKNRSMLGVSIDTGRQHQIRAHTAWLGHAIVGDERYGTKGGRMGLHAHKLHFIHPSSKNKIALEVDAPFGFEGLLC